MIEMVEGFGVVVEEVNKMFGGASNRRAWKASL